SEKAGVCFPNHDRYQGFYEFYQNNQNKTFEELIKMRFNSSAIDPIYGKKDDASILVIDV
ncbi:hypothetical protein, partial [Streptococcus pneumoniae]|uniref:hypothetical protein n=1 Tax=Streptococcus pneumoniae TaxID=1313 RepID=UPI000A107DA0